MSNQQLNKDAFKSALQDAMAQMGGDFATTESSFNEAIGNSSLLPIGEHACSIQSAEFTHGDYGPQIVVIWTDAEGATIKQYVSIFATDKDDPTKIVGYSRGYSSLMNCLATDMTFKLAYLKSIPERALNDDTTLIDALTGMKAIVVVVKGKKGYDIVEETGKFFVKDVATEELLLENSFDSLKDAAAMAKAEGYKRAYNRVHYLKPDSEEIEKNEEALKKILTL